MSLWQYEQTYGALGGYDKVEDYISFNDSYVANR